MNGIVFAMFKVYSNHSFQFTHHMSSFMISARSSADGSELSQNQAKNDLGVEAASARILAFLLSREEPPLAALAAAAAAVAEAFCCALACKS